MGNGWPSTYANLRDESAGWFWLPDFSGDRCSSLRVLDRLIELGFAPGIEYYDDGVWWVCWDTWEEPVGDPSFSLAICRAALQAVEALLEDEMERKKRS